MPFVDTEDAGGLDQPLNDTSVHTMAGRWGPEPVIDTYGNALPGLQAWLYYTDGETLAPVYTDRTKGLQADNPMSTDGSGNLDFFASPGEYILRFVSGGATLDEMEVTVFPNPEELNDFIPLSISAVPAPVSGDIPSHDGTTFIAQSPDELDIPLRSNNETISGDFDFTGDVDIQGTLGNVAAVSGDIPSHDGTSFKPKSLAELDLATVTASDAAYLRVFGIGDATGTAATDVAAIQAAIDAANTAGGGRVVGTPGDNYAVEVTTDGTSYVALKLKDNVTLDLTGVTLTMDTSAQSNYQIVQVWGRTNAHIVGGTIIGDRDTNTSGTGEHGHGVDFRDSTDCTARGVTVQDCWGDGFYLGNTSTTCTNIRLIDCHTDNARRNGCSVITAVGGGIFGGSYSNTVGTAPQGGIDIEPNAGESVSGFKVIGAEISGNAGGGFQVYGVAAGASVSGCIISGNRSTGNASGFTCRGLNDSAITGNVVDTTVTGVGISVYESSRVAVSGNTVKDAVGIGIKVHGTTATPIVGNTLTGNTVTGAGSYGIQVLADTNEKCRDTTVTGNTVADSADHGIYLLFTEDSTVTGNVVTGAGVDGIRLHDNDRGTVAANMARDSAKIGIHLINGSTFNSITGNTCTENGHHGIRLDGSSDNAVTGNLCYANSQLVDATYDNINITGDANRNSVQSNVCRQGALTNKPRYGLYVATSTADDNLVTNNDLTDSGATGNLSDSGTGTVTTAGNRT